MPAVFQVRRNRLLFASRTLTYITRAIMLPLCMAVLSQEARLKALEEKAAVEERRRKASEAEQRRKVK